MKYGRRTWKVVRKDHNLNIYMLVFVWKCKDDELIMLQILMFIKFCGKKDAMCILTSKLFN